MSARRGFVYGVLLGCVVLGDLHQLDPNPGEATRPRPPFVEALMPGTVLLAHQARASSDDINVR